MKKTEWFSVDDGQPTIPGLYEVAYSFETGMNYDYEFDLSYWDGSLWLRHKGGFPLSFGNEDTKGERWRGLAEDPNKKDEA